MPDTNSESSKSEADAQHRILLAFGALPWLRIWRQNTGKAYGYSVVRGALALMYSGKFELAFTKFKSMQLTTYGNPGAADIQGLLGPSRYGDTGGRFLAIEVKGTKGKQNDDQIAWQAMIEAKGGIYILAKTVEDVQIALRGFGYPA